LKSTKKILFCGKKDDIYSKKILNFLKKKKINLNIILTNRKKKLTKKQLNLIYLNKYDYIFCFRSHIIIKTKKLNKNTIAINFHPGPPKYRGIGCVNFALLNRENKYGATAHLINSKIDNGPILNVRSFRISYDLSIERVLKKTYEIQIIQFKELVNKLLTEKNYLNRILKRNKHIKWSKRLYLKEDLLKLYNLTNNFKKHDLNDLLRATLTKKYNPYFKIQNMLFKL